MRAGACLHRFPCDWPTCGAGWTLSEGEKRGADPVSQLWSEEWARMKKLLIKACPAIRKAAPTLQGESRHLRPGGEMAPSSMNGRFCSDTLWQQELLEATATSNFLLGLVYCEGFQTLIGIKITWGGGTSGNRGLVLPPKIVIPYLCISVSSSEVIEMLKFKSSM